MSGKTGKRRLSGFVGWELEMSGGPTTVLKSAASSEGIPRTSPAALSFKTSTFSSFYRNIVCIQQFASIVLQNYTNVGINSHVILFNAFSERFIFKEIFNVVAPHYYLFISLLIYETLMQLVKEKQLK